MIKLFQFCIIVAVIGSNGQYHWTPNPVVPAILGLGAAMFASAILMKLLSLCGLVSLPLKRLDQ